MDPYWLFLIVPANLLAGFIGGYVTGATLPFLRAYFR